VCESVDVLQEGASFADRVRIAWERHLGLGTGGAGHRRGAGVLGGGEGGSSGTGDASGAELGASLPDERMFLVEGGTSVAVRLPDL
jgi:hypothetical protein